MSKTDHRDLLRRATELAVNYLNGIGERPVGVPVSYPEQLARMSVPFTEEGEDPLRVIEQLSAAADPGLVATVGPRYFGFVIGGVYPVGLAAEWLTSAWDQNAFSFVLSPAASVAEEVVRLWLVDLFGLPPETSLGFVTGGTMANFTAIAAGRHALLKKLGWDVEKQGLFGAPEIAVLVSEESHVSIFAALQMLGLGRERVLKVPTDAQGRVRPDELRTALSGIDRPPLVCIQAGNVNTGSFDPLPEVAGLVRERAGWVHYDGAFGLWAAASPRHRHLVGDIHLADSVTVDCHKWLNVPYDSALVFVRDREAHQKAMALHASYYAPGPDDARDNHDWVPEASRRARGFTAYAVLRALGRRGLAEVVENCCGMARRMAERLAADARVEILNDVVLNQALARFTPSNGGDADKFTADVIREVQKDGTCWVGGANWHGMQVMRLSVSNWATTESDIDISAQAILRCVDRLDARG